MAYAKRITVSRIEEHSKGGSKFLDPRKINVRSPRRSTRNSKPLADDQDVKIHDVPAYSNVTPIKSRKEMPTFKAPMVDENTRPLKATNSFQQIR